MGKAIVCQKAELECQFGDIPDKLISVSPNDQYVNDADEGKKMIASTLDVGQPFEKKTFGKCKKQPTPGGYRTCQAQITEWKEAYEEVTLNNGGNPLLESSKAVCPIAGSPCISVTFHGQTGTASEKMMEEADPVVMAQLNPLGVSTGKEEPNQKK